MLNDVYKTDKDIEQALFNALYTLMMKIDFDLIGVSDIVNAAHVSRASFYRRFKDKYDLLNKTYENILEKTLFKFKENLSWKESIYQIYKIIYENKEFFLNAFSSNDVNCFRNYLYLQAFELEKEVLKNNGINVDDPYHYYRIAGYSLQGTELTHLWLKRKCDLTLDEMVKLLVEAVPFEYREYFE